MKYALEFQFNVYKNEIEPDYDSVVLIGDDWWLDQSWDFDTGYWDWFIDKDNTPKIETLTPGKYHVFEYGNVEEEWSYNYEYGVRDFDGFTFEPEHSNIAEMK